VRHQYNLNVETCHENLEEFIKALRDVLGESASMIVENIVARKLCASFNLRDADETSSLIDLTERLKSLKHERSARIEKEV